MELRRIFFTELSRLEMMRFESEFFKMVFWKSLRNYFSQSYVSLSFLSAIQSVPLWKDMECTLPYISLRKKLRILSPFLRCNVNTMVFICQIESANNEPAGWNNSIRNTLANSDRESSTRQIRDNKANERAWVWVLIIEWMSDSRCLPPKLNPDCGMKRSGFPRATPFPSE